MNKFLLSFLFLLASLTLFSQSFEADEKAIRSTFEGYRMAVLASDGEEATTFVNSKSIKYYAELLEETLTADSVEIENLNILNKIMVLMLRHRVPEESLLKMDGRTLLVYALDEGMISKSSVQNNKLGQLEINDSYAIGEILVNNEPSPVDFGFSKEDNRWLLDLTAVFPIAEMAFQKLVDESDQAENDYLFFLLEILEGERPTEKVWQPLK